MGMSFRAVPDYGYGLGRTLASGGLVSSGLVMLLDGADTSTMTRSTNRVDEWRDKLGSGNKVATGFAGTTYNPSYNSSLFGGAGGVRFTGTSNHFLETASAFSTMSWATGWTILWVAQHANKSTFLWGSDGGAYHLGGFGYQSRFGVGASGLTRDGIPRSTTAIFGSRYKSGDGGFQFIREGTLISFQDGSATVGTSTFGKLQIGGFVPGGACSLDVRAVYIYNRALSASEISQMNTYLQTTYSVSPLSSASHNVVVDGNSLSLGYSSTANWTMLDGIEASTGAISAKDIQFAGRSGNSTTALDADAATRVDTLLNTGVAENRRILIMWEITNDLSQSGVDATAGYNNIKAYCEARKAAGWKVIVCTCLPRSNAGLVADFETKRSTVNASIVANAVSEGWADYVADIASNTDIGESGDSNNTTYYNADKIHLTSTGHNSAKTYITSAVNAILAS